MVDSCGPLRTRDSQLLISPADWCNLWPLEVVYAGAFGSGAGRYASGFLQVGSLSPRTVAQLRQPMLLIGVLAD